MLVRYFTAAPGALSCLEKTFFFVLVNTYIHGRYTVSKKQCGKWHSKSSRDKVHQMVYISFLLESGTPKHVWKLKEGN